MRISQCMIVKNEEGNIERALSWGKGFVWEQIVIDTGSTDRTVEIAESMGADIYHFDWIDDFAAAKNFAVSKAKGDWIAMLDADEYFTSEGVKELLYLLEELHPTDTEAVVTAMVNLKKDGMAGMVGTQIRVFRNRPEIRYVRRIHEQLIVAEGKRTLRLVDVSQSISIFHTGYYGDVYAEKKADGRNLRLLQEELKEHPGDYELLGYLGDEYRDTEQPEEAVRYYREAIENMPLLLDELDARSAATFFHLLHIMANEHALGEEIEEIYQQAVKRLPKDADFDYIVGRYFAAEGEYARGRQHLERAMEKLERFGTNNRSMWIQANLLDAYEIMAICCFHEGEQQKAVSCSIAVLKHNPYSMTALITLLKAFRGNDASPQTPADQVAGFLQKLYDISSFRDRSVLQSAARELQWPSLEEALRRHSV